jgi:Na+/pantothenate symporter
MMNWNLALSALAAVTVVSMAAGFLGARKYAQQQYAGPIQDFVLASKGLERQSLIQLLLSTSFSLNGMLYQTWLGHKIGLWGLVVQAFWVASFFWLAKYVDQVRGAPSLHAFLGQRFGTRTRVLAAACSVIGFSIFVGWEFNVGKSTFAGLLEPAGGLYDYLAWFMIATVFVSVLYTAVGGLAGDAIADLIQNIVKLSVYVLMAALLFIVARNAGATDTILPRLFPPLSAPIVELGILGFITNIAFSALWQFVDMSAWQSIIASKNRLDNDGAKSALRLSGFAVFVAPGIIGTLLGAFMLASPEINADNIMARLISTLPITNPVFAFLVFVALLATIMSVVDGIMLAASYSLVCDIIYRNESLEDLDSDKSRSFKILAALRVALAAVAIIGSLGVMVLVERFGVSLFNITYVLIICQLALVGPVFYGLKNSVAAGDKMVWAIAFGLVIGLASLVCSILSGQEWLLTGAGLFTIIASYLSAALFSRRASQRASA